MALFYSINGIGKEIELHVGDTQGIKKMNFFGLWCLDLQADGNELEAIRNQFTGIPMHNGRVVKWFGADAAFIAMHLK